MPNLKQPFAGIAASALVIAVSLGFISLFDAPKFMGWVSFCLISVIPMEIVIGIAWGCKKPEFAASCPQPLKGFLLILLTLVAGAVGGAATRAVVGGNVNPPVPMLMMCTIAMVVVTFTATIMFGGWPFSSFIKDPVAAGLTMLAACYVINFLLFRLFFNYAFMQGAPVYVASLDPRGLFNANLALVFYITFNSIMFLVLNFDLWPFTLSASLMRQPVLGLVWTLALPGAGWSHLLRRNLRSRNRPAPIHGPRSHPVHLRDDYRHEHAAWNSVQQVRAAGERCSECPDLSRNRHRACAALWRPLPVDQRPAQVRSTGK